MKDKIFGVLQRVGRSFMLPIAILPIAGLFLGIGGAFTNETMLNAYRLTGVMGPGTPIYAVLQVLNACGNIVFANLPLIFAIGIAIGMAKQEKEVAALAGAIAFLVMHAAISAMALNAYGEAGVAEHMAGGSMTSVLGINSLQMGVFGGIIVGLGTAALHNRFYNIRLPQVLSFFGGTRFVPIISSAVYLLVGILMFFVWPPIQTGITYIGRLVQNSGYVGTWIYGLTERALIPFGLHHVFYLPFWQTNVGGTMEIMGKTWEGAQNIFFAQLSDPSVNHFAVSATRFMAGKFPLMIFGLPGAALAMYHCAKSEKRKVAGGLLLSAALTSMLTGITEPLEFTFLFVAPLLYVIHCILAGLAYMLMHIFNVGVGMTFSGGLIDLFLFGILQGNAKTDWINVVLVGIAYFAIYYFLFRFLIKKFNYKTPGREDIGETKLYTRADVNARKEAQSPQGMLDERSSLIVLGLGGKDNIRDLDCCATRLRVTVEDGSLVEEAALKESGAVGVIRKGNGVQVIYGPIVTVVKSDLEAYLASGAEPKAAAAQAKSKPAKSISLYAPMTGRVVPKEQIPDEVFSQGVLGECVAIDPSEGKVYAPANCTVASVFETKHALSLRTDTGVELLIHMGLDTVKLQGNHFCIHVKDGDRVKKGQLLAEFDKKGIQADGYSTVTPVVICNSGDFAAVAPAYEKETIAHGELLFTLQQ
ncbi:MAG: glucose PTS transporter subunit IIA [Clostridia bacterium]|nr:glucose PTS transporter subunit IIA [Clostridia bacterium]